MKRKKDNCSPRLAYLVIVLLFGINRVSVVRGDRRRTNILTSNNILLNHIYYSVCCTKRFNMPGTLKPIVLLYCFFLFITSYIKDKYGWFLTCLGSLEKKNIKSVNTTIPRTLTRDRGLLCSVSTNKKITTAPATSVVNNLQGKQKILNAHKGTCIFLCASEISVKHFLQSVLHALESRWYGYKIQIQNFNQNNMNADTHTIKP